MAGDNLETQSKPLDTVIPDDNFDFHTDTASELEAIGESLDSLVLDLDKMVTDKLGETDRVLIQELIARALERKKLRTIVREFRVQLKAKLIEKLKQTGSATKEAASEALGEFQKGSQQLVRDVLDSEVIKVFRADFGQATMAFTTVFKDARDDILKDVETKATAFKEKALQEAALKGRAILENEVTQVFYEELLQSTVETVVAMAKDLAEGNKEPLAKLRDGDTYRKVISHLADQVKIHGRPIWDKVRHTIARQSRKGFAFGKELATQLADDTKKMLAARQEVKKENKKPDGKDKSVQDERLPSKK